MMLLSLMQDTQISALHCAAQSGSDIGVRMLLDSNADISKETTVNATPPP
jgi:hypothetical protein